MYNLNDNQRHKILNNFKQVIDKKDSHLIEDDLYNHLNLNCNFASHFTLHGFQEAFSSKEGFEEFSSYFNSKSPQSEWVHAPEISNNYLELNKSMVNYVSEHAENNRLDG